MTGVIAGVVLTLSTLIQAAPQDAGAQPAAAAKPPVPVAVLDQTRKAYLAAAEAMPEADYQLRLAPGVRSFAEVIGHAVDTNFGVCAGARRLESPRKGQRTEGVVTARPDLLRLLGESFDYCREYAGAEKNPSSDLLFLISHNARGIGFLEMYLRHNGIAFTSPELDLPAPKGK
jgi:hypothetical protein